MLWRLSAAGGEHGSGVVGTASDAGELNDDGLLTILVGAGPPVGGDKRVYCPKLWVEGGPH